MSMTTTLTNNTGREIPGNIPFPSTKVGSSPVVSRQNNIANNKSMNVRYCIFMLLAFSLGCLYKTIKEMDSETKSLLVRPESINKTNAEKAGKGEKSEKLIKTAPDVESIPTLFLLGFQKCGTKAAREIMFHKRNVCVSKHGEPSYWGKHDKIALGDYPTIDQVNKQFLQTEFGHCHSNSSTPMLQFLKSPCIVMQPWVAPALKTLLPEAKIAIAIRDPTTRAFSAFFQNWKWLKEAPSLKAKNITSPTADTFHDLVALEIIISQKCRFSFGELSGLFNDDWSIVHQFNRCCRQEATNHLHPNWPGCDAYGMKVSPESAPRTLPDVNFVGNGINSTKGIGWQTTPLGGYAFNFVREGVYVDVLQPWLRSYGVANIYAFTNSELRHNESAVVDDLIHYATLRNDKAKHKRMIGDIVAEWNSTLTDNVLFQTLKTKGRKWGVVPRKDTINLLKQYYQPNNLRLNKVFGQNLLQTYESLQSLT